MASQTYTVQKVCHIRDRACSFFYKLDSTRASGLQGTELRIEVTEKQTVNLAVSAHLQALIPAIESKTEAANTLWPVV